MKLNKILMFLIWVRAMSEEMADRPLVKPFYLSLSPLILASEIDMLIENVLSEIKAALWKELWLNPKHEAANLQVRVDIKNGNSFRGYILSSPAGLDNLDERFFKVTSSFAEPLRGDLCWYIINSTNFKSLMVGLNPTDFPQPTNPERRCFSL